MSQYLSAIPADASARMFSRVSAGLRKVFPFLALLFLAAACRPEPAPVPEQARRTVLVYLAGDNNLSSEVDMKVAALCEGLRSVDGRYYRMVAFADYRDGMPRLMELRADGPKTLVTYPAMNAADPENLARVVAEAVQRYPADSYGLICFSHASGWLPAGALSDPEGYGTSSSGAVPSSVFQDGSAEMASDDFARAVRLPDGRRYDFIVMETCYMAGIEVAYPLRDAADFLVASSAEMVSPGLVHCYPEHLSRLFAPEADLEGFAGAYFGYWSSQSGAARSATVSVIDLRKIGALSEEVARVLRNAKYLISDPAGIQHFNRNPYRLFFDLTDYLEASVGEEALSSLDAYRALLQQTVPYAAATPSFMPGYPYSFNIRTHCGLTVYIRQPGLEKLNRDYEQTEFYRALFR